MTITEYPSSFVPSGSGLRITGTVFEGITSSNGFYTHTGTIPPGYYLLVGDIWFAKGSKTQVLLSKTNSSQTTALIRVTTDETEFSVITSPRINGERISSLGLLSLSNPTHLIHDGTYYYAFRTGSAYLMVSTDAVTWTVRRITNLLAVAQYRSIAYNGSLTNKWISSMLATTRF